jgi:hypothetical protein
LTVQVKSWMCPEESRKIKLCVTVFTHFQN